MGKSAQSHDPAAVAAWQQKCAALAAEVRAWSEGHGWQVASERQSITENGTPPYEVTALIIALPEGEVRLEPVSMGWRGLGGRVELAAWPSLHRVRLVDRDGQWAIVTLSGIDYPMPWGRDTFIHLARELAAAP